MSNYAHDLAERLDNDLDRVGWATDDDLRRTATFKWMQTVTQALVTVLNRADAADELEAKLIERGVL